MLCRAVLPEQYLLCLASATASVAQLVDQYASLHGRLRSGKAQAVTSFVSQLDSSSQGLYAVVNPQGAACKPCTIHLPAW